MLVTDKEFVSMAHSCKHYKIGCYCAGICLPMCKVCNITNAITKPVPFSAEYTFFGYPGELLEANNVISKMTSASVTSKELPVNISFEGKQFLHSYKYTTDYIRDTLKIIMLFYTINQGMNAVLTCSQNQKEK